MIVSDRVLENQCYSRLLFIIASAATNNPVHNETISICRIENIYPPSIFLNFTSSTIPGTHNTAIVDWQPTHFWVVENDSKLHAVHWSLENNMTLWIHFWCVHTIWYSTDWKYPTQIQQSIQNMKTHYLKKYIFAGVSNG